jgi:DNA-binding beta-propeller fold protein YncE
MAAVKHCMAKERGIKPRDARLYVNDATNQPHDSEMLEKFLHSAEEEAKLEMCLLIDKADAQQVVPDLAAKADRVLGKENSTQTSSPSNFHFPSGVAFVPAQPDWVVTTEFFNHRVKITNTCTGKLVCMFGEKGSGEGQFSSPWGCAVTADSSFVLVTDVKNNRVQMLRLITDAAPNTAQISARLEFASFLGKGKLQDPSYCALTLGGDGMQTLLVSEFGGHCVSQFSLDGTSSCIFAGTGTKSSLDGGLDCPCGLTVLPSAEVAVADWFNHRVQIFDSKGNYARQFGTKGGQKNGQLQSPTGLASDAHGNLIVTDYTSRLQVFSPEGKHLFTRSDLGYSSKGNKDVAWCGVAGLAIANSQKNTVLLWERPGSEAS